MNAEGPGPMIFCVACEARSAVQADLGANDGSIGRVAGVSCHGCGYIRAAGGAPFVPEGHVDLRGMTALEWMLTGLSAAGCDPRPRP